MSPDEEAENALRGAYGKALSERLAEFRIDLGSGLDGLSLDTVVRMFMHYASFSSYSVWRGIALQHAEVQARQEVQQGGSNGQAGRSPSPGAAQLRAAQVISGGARLTLPEWNRAVDWAKAHGGRRLKGDDGRWNVSEAELAEALG